MGLILLFMSVLAFAILGPVVTSHQGSEQNRTSPAQALTVVIMSLKRRWSSWLADMAPMAALSMPATVPVTLPIPVHKGN